MTGTSALVLVWACLVSARGQETSEDITVTGRPPDPEEDAGATTVVYTADLPPSADVADAVGRAPGAVVRRLGGLGDLAEVNLRAAGSRRVEVLLDGIPLNPEGGASVDLSEIPLRAFERVVIARGISPALLGSTALGGVISLQLSEADTRELLIGAGSTIGARGQGSIGLSKGEDAHLWISAEALADEGRFHYLDDGGTRGVEEDDQIVWRENNDTRSLSTLLRARLGHVSLLYSGALRDDGLPGPIYAPSSRARYGLQRHLVGLQGATSIGASELSARLYGLHRADSVSDPLDEIGLGSGSTGETTEALGLGSSLRAPLSRSLRADLALAGRLDRYSDAQQIASRSVWKAASGVHFQKGTLSLSPSLLALLVAAKAPLGFVLPRASASIRPAEPLRVELNAGLGARPPDLLELYGDRGALVGNPSLSPERGMQSDLGVAWSPGAARLDVVGYLSHYREMIVWVAGPRGVSRPENVSSALVSGLEVAGSAEHGIFSLSSQLALSRAVNTSGDPSYQGNQLPNTPIAEISLQSALSQGPLRASSDAAFLAGGFTDTANVARAPPRLLFGASCELWDRRRIVALALDARNLLGTRTASVPRDPLVDDGVRVQQPLMDFAGYPLPGRTLWLSLRLRGS